MFRNVKHRKIRGFLNKYNTINSTQLQTQRRDSSEKGSEQLWSGLPSQFRQHDLQHEESQHKTLALTNKGLLLF
jgi:hypothetical protein